MSLVTRSIVIDADRGRVWHVVSDLEAVNQWNPSVKSASCGEVRWGVGATRTCNLSPVGTLHERVSGWVPTEELWFAVGRHGAIRSADIGMVLCDHQAGESGSATRVDAIVDYHLAFGPLGPVIDQLSIKGMLTRMLDTSLAGLKAHLEQSLVPPFPDPQSPASSPERNTP